MTNRSVKKQFGGCGRLVAATALAAALLATPAAGTAQSGPDRIPAEGFFWAQLAAPLGEFNDNVGLGGGVGLGGLLYLGDQRYAALRAEGSFVVYGSDTVRRPLSPTIPFVDVDVKTTNSILTAGVGPQIFLATGPIRPYIYGTVGLSYFVTQTSVKGDHEDEPIASTTNFDDLNFPAVRRRRALGETVRGGRVGPSGPVRRLQPQRTGGIRDRGGTAGASRRRLDGGPHREQRQPHHLPRGDFDRAQLVTNG